MPNDKDKIQADLEAVQAKARAAEKGGSYDTVYHRFEERLLAALKELERPAKKPKAAEELPNLEVD